MENNKLFKQYVEKKDTYDLFGKKLVDLIEGLLIRDKIDYQSISYRVKSEDSFRNKVIKKKKYKDITDMTDVCGVRIITYYSDTVDKVAKIMTEQFEIDEENTIDKRKALDPDRFGYLSLHYVISLKDDRLSLPEYSIFKDIKVEIQIRSISQHAWAEIEHDLGYKTKKEIPKEIRRDFSRLASLLELVDKEFVEIRSKLNSYADEAKESIKTSSEKTLIDSVTLSVYANSSKELEELDRAISIKSKIKLTSDMCNVSNYITCLESVGFNTIQEINNEIKNNIETISNLAREVFNNSPTFDNYIFNDSLNRGIGLFYLCYYKICQTDSLDKIKEFLIICNISEEDRSPEELSKDLLKCYYNSIGKK